ncbi:MAG: peptidyl-prolyl cis-trans isomerase [Acidobacteria bacterium]|nr:peptidyl-prolyl cis-trans isomerase [Acidobacteriota bacterium]
MIILFMFHLVQDLAVYDGGTVTRDELNVYFEGGTELESKPSAENEFQAWVTLMIERIAAEKLMEQHPVAVRLMNSAEYQAECWWHVCAQQVEDQRQSLRKTLEPDPERVEQKRLELSDAGTYAMFNFCVITLLRGGLKGLDEAKMATLTETVNQALESGTDFEEVAKMYSMGSGAQSGGYLHMIPAKSLDAELTKTLFEMEEDQVAGPIETRTGVHWLKLKKAHIPTYDQTDVLARAYNLVLDEQVSETIQIRATELSQSNQQGIDSIIQTIRPDVRALLEERASATKGVESMAKLICQAALSGHLDPRKTALWPTSERTLSLKATQEVMQTLVQDRTKTLPDEVIKNYYLAHKHQFKRPEARKTTLWFFDKQPDAYQQQMFLESLVSELRGLNSIERNARLDALSNRKLESSWRTQREHNQLNPNILGATSDLQPGSLSNPIYCPHSTNLLGNPPQWARGFAIATVDGIRPIEALPFEEAIDQVRHAYMMEHHVSLANEALRDLLNQKHFRIVTLPDAGDL